MLGELAHRFGPAGVAEGFFRRFGIWCLLAFALAYDGYYCRVWPGPGGEGGLVALLSQRLLEGQRPFVDTFLGYNVLWFYPVVGLFKVLGPNYLAMRLFFFLLCLITGLLSFRLVLKCTGRAWVAFLAGFLVLLVPGQTYRNYMALLVVLNMTTFLPAYVLPARHLSSRLCWMVASGVSLGAAFLVRIDLGYFLTFILLGLLLAFPITHRDTGPWLRRLPMTVAGLFLALSGLFLTHLPVYLDAAHRGFGKEFAAQYRQWPEVIVSYGKPVIETTGGMFAVHTEAVSKQSPAARAATNKGSPVLTGGSVAGNAAPPAPVAATRAIKEVKITKGAQERRSLMAPKARDKMLALNLYLPIPVSIMLLAGSLFAWIMALRRRDDASARSALTLLTALGCALVLFPQYFFWQPNMVHLSEFMVPMTLVIILSCAAAISAWKGVGVAVRIVLGIYLTVSSMALVLYYINACQSGGSGGIAVSLNKNRMFHGANGVDVVMNAREFEDNTALFRVITAVSFPGEFVICYPYHPEVNFMTDRPSYEHNVYADNDIPGDRFHRALLKNVGNHSPVVFVINNWDINGTEESRFYNWARESYGYITSHYVLACKSGDFEIYVRPDRADRIPAEYRQAN